MSRCGCANPPDATGSLCAVTDTDCFTHSGDGSEDVPFTFSPVINASINNLFTCGADGMMATLPATISNPPACSAYKTSPQSIANNTLTAVTLNVENYDTDTMHSISANTSRITFTTAGYYTVTWNLTWQKNATGNRLAYIRKDGTTQVGYASVLTGGADLLVGQSVVYQGVFTAGQYVEGMVHQTSGAALQVLADSYSPILAAVFDA